MKIRFAVAIAVSAFSALAFAQGAPDPRSGATTPVQVMNGPSNPVPVTGSVTISGTPSISLNGTVKATSSDKTALLLDTNLFLTSGLNEVTSDKIDVSSYRSVRVVVAPDSCTGCGPVRIFIHTPFTIDVATLPASTGDSSARTFSRVYDVPGDQMAIRIQHVNVGEQSDWVVRLHGRAN